VLPSLRNTSTLIMWSTRVIASLITIVFVLILILNATQIIPYVTRIHRTLNLNMIMSVVPGILVLVGYTLSWWRERTGGVFFILASVLIGLDYLRTWSIIRPSITIPSDVFPPGYTVIGTQNAFFWVFRAWAILGLPLLVVGIMFFVISRLSKMKRLSGN
jgi:hypothetical protein